MEKKYKYYLILEKRSKQLHGAFVYSEDGLAHAKKYVKKIGGLRKFTIEAR